MRKLNACRNRWLVLFETTEYGMSDLDLYSSAGHDRTRKVASVIHRELSEIIVKELSDPRVKVITITNIEVSKDLKHAKAYVTSRLSPETLLSGVKALNHAASYIRRQLGSRLTMKYTPSVRFYEDASIERGSRVAALIDSIAESGKVESR